MGIWIRSQDKRHLINVIVLYLSEIIIIRGVVSEGYDFILGKYKTQIRSLEIISEIQENIRLGNRTFDMPQE
jgi:hypothetical protein